MRTSGQKQENNNESALWDQPVKNQNKRSKRTRARKFLTRYCLYVFIPTRACVFENSDLAYSFVFTVSNELRQSKWFLFFYVFCFVLFLIMFLLCLYCVHGKSVFPIQFEDLGLLENLTLGDGSEMVEMEEVRPESHNAFQ